jgi:uncharacterized membrane protein
MKLQKLNWQWIILFAVSVLIACSPYLRNSDNNFMKAFLSPFISLSVLCLWMAISGNNQKQRKLMVNSLLIGLIIGIISFLGGFIGPIILTPEANQGPLLGIFFTGPIGFAAGILLGIPGSIIYLKRKEGKEKNLI